MAQDQKQNASEFFAMLFNDLLQNLTTMFPECAATKTYLNLTPTSLEIIKQDWFTHITPYTLKSFKYAGNYFGRIREEVPATHPFNKLQLLEKFNMMDDDSKDNLCLMLSDLEMFACAKAGSQKEEKTIKGKGRFDDPKLHEMCVKTLGDRKLAEELRTICSNNIYFNRMYENKTNEQIVQQLKSTKPLLPLFIRLVKSKSLPMDAIAKFMERRTQSSQSQISNPSKK